MATLELCIIDPDGLHARPASLLCKEAARYDEDILLTYQSRTVDMKSILGVMSLAVPTGATVTIEVKSERSDDIIRSLHQSFASLNLI